VFLVDDHEMVRRGVADLLESEDDVTVIGQAASAAQALTQIPILRPDVAVLDMRLPDGNVVELCGDLRSAMPELNWLLDEPRQPRWQPNGAAVAPTSSASWAFSACWPVRG